MSCAKFKFLILSVTLFLFINITTPITKISANSSVSFELQNNKIDKYKKRGELLVNFIDINGFELPELSKKFTGFVDQKYDLTVWQKPIRPGYKAVLFKGKEKGQYKEQPQDVIYRYEPENSKDLVVKSIKYVHKHDPSSPIRAENQIKGIDKEEYSIGDKYKEKIVGYNIEYGKDSAFEHGYFSKKDNPPIIYTYESKEHYHPEEGNSKVGEIKLIKEDKANIINIIDEPNILEGYDNDPYDLAIYKDIKDKKNKDVYEAEDLKEGSDKLKGKFKAKNSSTFHYLYKVKQDKQNLFNCDITIKYLDEKGKEIPQHTKKFKGIENQLYDLKKLKKPNIEGYDINLNTGEEIGTYKKTPQVITYKIKLKDPSNMVIKKIRYVYKHDDTKTILPSEKITGLVGKEYDANNKIQKINDYNISISSKGDPIKGIFKKDDNKPIIIEYTYIPEYNPVNEKSKTGRVVIVREDIENPINFIEEPTRITGKDLDPYDTDNYTELQDEENRKNYKLVSIKSGDKSKGKFKARKEYKVTYQYQAISSIKKDN